MFYVALTLELGLMQIITLHALAWKVIFSLFFTLNLFFFWYFLKNFLLREKKCFLWHHEFWMSTFTGIFFIGLAFLHYYKIG